MTGSSAPNPAQVSTKPKEDVTCTCYSLFSLDVKEIYQTKYKDNIFKKMNTTDMMRLNGIIWKTLPRLIKNRYKDLATFIRGNPKEGLDWKSSEGRRAYKKMINMPDGHDFIPMPPE
jgi:hypothetical protein